MVFYCETYITCIYEVFGVIVAFVLHFNTNIYISITAGGSWLEEFLECCGQVVERAEKFTRLRLQVGVWIVPMLFDAWVLFKEIIWQPFYTVIFLRESEPCSPAGAAVWDQ